MRTIQRLTVLAALSSCLIPAAFAAKRFDSPRPIEGACGSSRRRCLRTGSRPSRRAPSLDQHVRCLADVRLRGGQVATNYLWCDFEQLEVIGAFSLPRPSRFMPRS